MGDKIKPGDKLPEGWSKKLSKDPLDETRAKGHPLDAIRRAAQHGDAAADDLTPRQLKERANQGKNDGPAR